MNAYPHRPSPRAGAVLDSTGPESVRTDASADGDREFLDGVFEQVLALLEEGCEVDAESLSAAREHLRPQIEQLIGVARGVAIGPVEAEPIVAPPGYRLLAELGRGGMGLVYLASQESAGGRTVALKYLRPVTAGSGRERLRREAEVIARLQHRHVVPVYDVIRAGDALVLVMEFIAGGSLQDVIRAMEVAEGASPSTCIRQTLGMAAGEVVGERVGVAAEQDSARLIARWGIEVADALHAVHAAGLLHRDVKPSNILLRPDGTALLSDFGLVRSSTAATMTATGVFAGTAAFSSPEQLRADRELTVRSDVYSLGATLFHALTLSKPYAGDSAVQVLRAMEHGAAPRIVTGSGGGVCGVGVPRDLATIVLKAMEQEPARRYGSAAELAADLERFLADRPIYARRPTVWTHAGKFIARNRRAVLSAGASAVVVAVGAGVVGAGLVMVPKWRDGAVAEARTSQFAAASMNSFISCVYYGYVSAPGLDPESAERVRAALAERQKRSVEAYDRAMFFGEQSPTVRAEREAAMAVLRVLDPSGGWSAHVPQSVHDEAERFLRARMPGESREWDVVARLPADRTPAMGHLDQFGVRQLAMVAQAVGDGPTALAAWEELERRGQTDPFASGALGVAYLYSDKPALAYARLERAVYELPGVFDFGMYLADAALACGDVGRARRLLEELQGRPERDEQGFARLSILLRWDEGDRAGALAAARPLMNEYAYLRWPSPLLGWQLLGRLEAVDWAAVGAQEEDLVACAVVASSGSPIPQRGLRAANRWIVGRWNRATREERRVNVLNMLAKPVPGERQDPNWAILLAPLFRSHDVFGQHESLGAIEPLKPEVDIGREGLIRIFERLNGIEAQDRAVVRAMPRELRDALADWILTGEGERPEEALRVMREMTAAQAK